MIRIALLGLLVVLAGQSMAATMYITDKFEIYMRSGESAKHRIVKTLRTGDEVKVLGQNRKTGYTHIEASNGKKGYVLTRQLLAEPVARTRIPELESRIQELETAPGELRQRLEEITTAHATLTEEHQSLTTQNQELEFQLAELKRVSADAVQIDAERKELRKQVATMTHQIEDQKQQIQEISNSSIQRWFMIGAGVLLGGIILGLILPNLNLRRRKDSWGSL
ncbi:MAG: TIGR04211 family SH3 domain-containing protein [bacterium]